MRLGLVAEGSTEAFLMEALIDRFFPGSEVRRIQPDVTLAAHLGAGWRGVRAWCIENGPRLEIVMRGISGDELDVLVIHADCSMAHNEGARRECPPASGTADALRECIRIDWLHAASLPDWLVLMTPSQMTDTWLLAGSGQIIRENLNPLECSFEADRELARIGIYRFKAGEVKKSGSVVEDLAAEVVLRWDAVQASCTEASRFWAELQAAAQNR